MTYESWEKVAAARVRVGLLRGPGDGACADRGGRLITCSSALLWADGVGAEALKTF